MLTGRLPIGNVGGGRETSEGSEGFSWPPTLLCKVFRQGNRKSAALIEGAPYRDVSAMSSGDGSG